MTTSLPLHLKDLTRSRAFSRFRSLQGPAITGIEKKLSIASDVFEATSMGPSGCSMKKRTAQRVCSPRGVVPAPGRTVRAQPGIP